jgi:hypothetical protein
MAKPFSSECKIYIYNNKKTEEMKDRKVQKYAYLEKRNFLMHKCMIFYG